MGLKCHVCKKLHEQVGKLSCGHQICGACFRSLSPMLEKCYLCIQNAPQLSRSNMQIVSVRANGFSTSKATEDGEDQMQRTREKLFCPNDSCDFIGTREELNSHRECCKFRLLSDDGTDSLQSSAVSSAENAINTSRELNALGLSKQVEDIWEQLDTINKRLKNRNPHRPQYDGEPTDGMIGRPMSKAASQRGAGLFEITTTAVIAVLVVYWYHGNQDISTLVRKSEPVAAPKRNVAFSFEGIEDLVTKARFNKRDMLLSKQMLMEQYKVKLGIGASLSSSGSEVKLWVSAIVNKDDENDWPIGEVLKLTLNHADPQKKRSYEFLSSHTGTWKESIRVHKATLLFRQIQVDSTKYQKYLRFSCLLNYEEALAAGYIDKDRVTVELSVII